MRRGNDERREVLDHLVVDGYGAAAGPVALSIVAERLPSTNDDAQTALPLPAAGIGDTNDLRDDFAGMCGGGGGLDAAYTFTLSSPSLVTLSAGGTDFDTVLSVRDGQGVESVCNDDALTGASFVEALLEPGTYTVALDGASVLDGGRYRLTSAIGDAPPSDGPSAPRPIWRHGTFAGTTVGLADDLPGSCAPTGGDAVFSLSLPIDGQVILKTARSAYDTVLHVHRADTMAEVGCSDDSYGTLQSSLELDLTAGEYFVVVDGYAGATGSFSLQAQTDAPL